MRPIRPPFVLRVALMVACVVSIASGQDPVTAALKIGSSDVAEIKRQAEAGDPSAQLSLGNTLLSNMRPSDALPWYRKAASQGSVEALYRWGNILLYGAVGIPPEKSVKAEPVTGIQLIYRAATNRYTAAYYDMHKGYRDGIGLVKDNVQSYAWLQLYVDSSPGLSVPQVELNRLALDVDVATSQAGKELAALYKAGHWPTMALGVSASPPAALVAGSSPKPSRPRTIQEAMQRLPVTELKLDGIAYGKTPLAIINGKGMAEGESATLATTARTVTIKCVKIETNSVLVSVDGEEIPRRLTWK